MEKQKQTMLEDLVPPLALCKQIPHPHFWNAAMCWRTFNKGRKDEYTIVFPTGTLDPHDDDVPAPTLQEILEELHKQQEDVFLKWSETAYNEWFVNAYTHNREDYQAHDSNPATAALKVWLNHKGIEVKQ